MTDRPRLIEVAFPLKQASIDSVHEKNVRHGHISTLHIWPARRPLAACRAALIATLLPDPGNAEERKKILEKLGGSVVKVSKKKKLPSGKVEVKDAEETVGGILHWGRESGPDLDWFRKKIQEAYGGRAPKVLDPFAGGGAIPLEAMRLGCEATAVDINPVAWFILKCTLEYPQKLAGQHLPLPQFALDSPEFMEGFFKGTGKLTKKQLERNIQAVQSRLFPPPDVDLAWHVRAWGWWVLQRSKKDLEQFYPTINGKPTVAYLWARTVICKNCRATIPLLKTRWLCKKDTKRVLLAMEPNARRTEVVFSVQQDVPAPGGNTAQRRENDKRLGQGTMSRAGASCPCCGKPGTVAMTSEDIRQEGLAGRLGTVMTAVVVDGLKGKEYRLPLADEIEAAAAAEAELPKLFAEIPFGLPDEPLPSKEALGFRVPLYGLDRWSKLFTARQLMALGTLTRAVRSVTQVPLWQGYPMDWSAGIAAYLALAVDRVANRASTLCMWNMPAEKIEQTFARFALPMMWDFAESNPLSDASGNFAGEIEWVQLVSSHTAKTAEGQGKGTAYCQSAISPQEGRFDIVVTDPPYYDAIPYSDLMDFFYVWLRRTLHGQSVEIDAAFAEPLGPKWSSEANDGELIDDASRFGSDKTRSKEVYEDGMYRAFRACDNALASDGRMVVVFANKQPDAWETLVSAMIRAGFVVEGSWPIQTERGGGVRNYGRASLASSVWLVCRKRPETARPGWDTQVLADMRERIATQLREFWDAGIRGPDFVWAATGPALEAYSRHPAVKKANAPGELMSVSEFLRAVRRIVVDFVVGRVLSHNGGGEAASGLDDTTTYYLLHRYDFGLKDAPVGPCILYAVSCGLSDHILADHLDILLRTGGQAAEEEEEAGDEAGGEEEAEAGTGSTVRLKDWKARRRPSMGYDPAIDSSKARAASAQQRLFPEDDSAPKPARQVPLIDQVHRLMHLWRAADVVKVDEYLDLRGLRRNQLFGQLLQALIELSDAGSEERSLLESISNHLKERGVAAEDSDRFLPGMGDNGTTEGS
jgi:putative DNA methylase